MVRLSRVEIVGAGPAGLYTAILLKRFFPDARVGVTEQGPANATWGFGVVFSDQALELMRGDDPETHDLLAPAMERWRNMALVHEGEAITVDGIGFAAIGRLRLLQILQDRARSAGAELVYETSVETPAGLEADLVVGADGLNSVVRRSDEAGFGATIGELNNRFAWFGSPRPFETLTQTFVRTTRGSMNAHHYRYAPDMSTFLVEADADTFLAHGFDRMDEQATARACEQIFADALQGAPLIGNRSIWRRFPKLWCRNWHVGNKVLVGDAAHTAHFSVGSGTRLAMEDSIALVRALAANEQLDEALAAYQADRQPTARKIVDAATSSALWYEQFPQKMAMRPYDFAYDYITRSGRVDDARLRRMSPQFMKAYEAHREAARMDGPSTEASLPIADPVGETAGAREIGFRKQDHPNCSAILFDNLAGNPDRTAVTGPRGTLSYRELCAEASRWGHAFHAFGLRRGERIAFLLDDTPAYPAAFFGAVRAGFVPVLLNTQSTADLLRFYLADAGVRVALCEASLLDRFGPEARDSTGLVLTVVVNGDGGTPADGFVDAAVFVDGHPEWLEVADTGPDDMAFWMYSSGSTGRPKGIVHLHHDMAYTQQSFGHHVLKLRPDDVCYSVPKIFFAYGFGNSFTFPFSVGATSLLVPGRPEADRVLDAIERFRPSVLFGLPTLYTALCRSLEQRSWDLGSLRLSLSAAETLSAEVFKAWQAATGRGPVEGLGSTELLHIYLSNIEADQRHGSAGARVPGYEVVLRDADGREVAGGEEGVMYVRADSSAPVYWNRPDKTAETMRGDWICTGDRFVERDGYYYFQGRTDDLIKVSGQWVWPLEVERCLNEHPHVDECAVLAHGLADKRMTLRAVVRLRDGVQACDSETRLLQDYVKQALLPHKYPRIVEYIDEMPKTGTGKIDRQALVAAGKRE